jgi:hypothetical protein
MTKNNNYPDWFLWAYQKGFVFWLAIAAVFGFSLLGVVFHLDNSVHDTEVRLQREVNRVGEEIQDDEDEQIRELREIREELDTIRRELRELREGK